MSADHALVGDRRPSLVQEGQVEVLLNSYAEPTVPGVEWRIDRDAADCLHRAYLDGLDETLKVVRIERHNSRVEVYIGVAVCLAILLGSVALWRTDLRKLSEVQALKAQQASAVFAAQAQVRAEQQRIQEQGVHIIRLQRERDSLATGLANVDYPRDTRLLRQLQQALLTTTKGQYCQVGFDHRSGVLEPGWYATCWPNEGAATLRFTGAPSFEAAARAFVQARTGKDPFER